MRRAWGLAAATLLSGGSAAFAAAPAGPVSELDVLRGDSASSGFQLALAPRPFVFPQDHGPHPQFRYEWWYVTGNLDSEGGERFGFELTFFRFALAPQAEATPHPTPGNQPPSEASRWRTRQIYMAHFAITDVARGEFRFARKYSREALGMAGADATPFRVWLDDWSLAGADGTWKLQAEEPEYGLSLELRPLAAPVLNGDRGLSRKSDEAGAASYYYSIPRMAARGHIVRRGRPVPVSGLAWLDREWGSGALGQRQTGWDWFALQLHDGSTLMLYSLRDSDGRRDSHSAGTWVDSAGRVRAISNDEMLIEVGDHWVSPRGVRYPSSWRVRVPGLGFDVQVRPVLADQELNTVPRYWEGAVDVSGTREGSSISGRGYVELVGYGE